MTLRRSRQYHYRPLLHLEGVPLRVADEIIDVIPCLGEKVLRGPTHLRTSSGHSNRHLAVCQEEPVM
jgi:hypothetical protein